ncbi:DoxX family membrane protein [Paenibacillus tarimensis]
MKFLKVNSYAAVILTLIRVYVGWIWLMQGWNKIAGESAFDASEFIKGWIANPVLDFATNQAQYPTYIWFLESIVLPNVGLFNFLVTYGEFLVGVGLILGCFTRAALFFGLVMNFSYLFSGAVSTNPWLILLGFILLTTGAGAVKFGIDRWVMPRLNLSSRFGLLAGKKFKAETN